MNNDFQSVMPLIPTGGTLAEALSFFTAQLGFETTRQWESGAIVRRGSVSFMLVPNNNREWADNASFSIGVTDLEAVPRVPHDRSIRRVSPVLSAGLTPLRARET